MRIATINDYTNPTAAQPSSYARNCPHLRMDFTGLSKSYNPFVSPRALALRRIAFLTIQFFHLTHLLFFTDSFSTSVSVLPATLLHIIFFVFTAWNLHLIVQMEGTRVVFGKVWGRGSFDVFLGCVVVSSGALLGWDFSIGGMEGTVEYSWFAADLLAILGVAWVATWEEGGAGVGLV